MNILMLILFALATTNVIEGAKKNCRCVCSPDGFDVAGSTVDLVISDNSEYDSNDLDGIDNDVVILPEDLIESTTNLIPATTRKSKTISKVTKINPPIPVYIVTPKPVTEAFIQPNKDFDACQQKFLIESLNAHNRYRVMHHVAPLKFDVNLQKTAMNYANYLSARDLFQHSGAKGLGENLAYVWSSRVDQLGDCSGFGERFVKMWYDEVSYYNFNRPGFAHSTGHFTQLVWKGTTHLGCGISISPENKIYGVCNYSPPGNFVGEKQFRANVLPR